MFRETNLKHNSGNTLTEFREILHSLKQVIFPISLTYTFEVLITIKKLWDYKKRKLQKQLKINM